MPGTTVEPRVMRVFGMFLFGMVGCVGGGDAVTDATDGPGPECAIEERDCAGVCFGDAVLDDCDRCDDDPSNDCVAFTVVNSSWTCKAGSSCQDVWEVDLPGSADVTIRVTEVSGDSLVRLGAFAPDSRPGGVNVLVGRNKDLVCWGVDEPAEATFRAPARGTWRITVGRDAAGSDGMFGAYTLEVESSEGLTMATTPFQDDVETGSVGVRCGNEYVFENIGWQCDPDESCQDSYLVELSEGDLLDLEITELSKTTVAGLGLYGPGDASGDVNLLTNTPNERVCTGQGEDLVAPPFRIPEDGTYTVAATRRADASSGDQGRYMIAMGVDGFFERPQPDNQDVRSAAPGGQCAWTFEASGSWMCPVGETCQDVFELDALAGATLAALVRNVTGSSVVRGALFEPGTKLSGTNLYTGAQTDWACTSPGEDTLLPPAKLEAGGLYQLAVGRDGAASTGTVGDYDLFVELRDGYGRGVRAVSDDVASQASGVECP